MIFNLMFATPQLSEIGVLVLDVLTTEELSLRGGVTKYAVEDGSNISDNIFRGETTVRISGTISSAEGFLMGTAKTRMVDALEALEMMHNNRQPITITTGLRQYTEMGIEELRAVRSADNGEGNWLEIEGRFTKIRKVVLQTAEVGEEKIAPAPSGKRGTGAQGKSGKTETPSSVNSTTGKQSGTPAEETSLLLRGMEGSGYGGTASDTVRGAAERIFKPVGGF